MAKPQLEKRATRRFKLELPLKMMSSDGGRETVSRTRDVSARGVCFYLDAPIAEGSQIQFTLELPAEVTLAGSVWVRCKGRVVRVESPNQLGKIAVAALIDRYEFLGDA